MDLHDAVQMPRMNAVMERWIQSCRRERLDRMLVWTWRICCTRCASTSSMTTRTVLLRGISNARLLHPLPEPASNPAAITHLAIRRRDRLGGLIREYEYAA
jgi:putative transposase